MDIWEEKIQALYDDGYTDSEIAQQLHISTKTVWHWRQGKKLPTHGQVRRQ